MIPASGSEHSLWRAAFAAQLRAEVGARNFTWQQVADRAGITTSSVSNYKNEVRDIPAPVLASICEALGVSLDRFVADVAKRRAEMGAAP